MQYFIMKRRELFSSMVLFLLLLPQAVFASWKIAGTSSAAPAREPFFQTGPAQKTPLPPASYRRVRYPNEYVNYGREATPMYAVSISGSLKENLERIMRRYHWKVVWKAPYDYNFDGRVTGNSLPNVIQKVLQPFPLQAVMYMSNRTVAVVPRQIR